MNTASTFVDSAFTRTAIYQEGNPSEALPSTHRILKAISPSVKWLKPSPAEQLPAFSERPPPTPLLHHCPAQPASVTTSQQVTAPSRIDGATTAARRCIPELKEIKIKAGNVTLSFHFS